MALQEECEKQGNFLFKYRGTLPLILLGASVIMFVYIQYYSLGYDKIVDYDLYELAALAVTFVGLIIRVFTVGYSAKLTSGRNTEKQIAETVNTTGIYSTVRHPLYVGNFFMWLGPALLVQNFWFIVAFIFVYWVYYERIMFAEEQFLRKKFGESYLKWAAKTPAFVFSFKNYVKPVESFSWKKIIRQEKNGFVAVFVVFFIFDAIKEYINTGSVSIQTWEFYAMTGSILLYLIIKSLLKLTSILDDDR